MLRKHLSLFLALLMIFTVIPEASLAENGVDEPESPTSIGFLNVDSCDETLVYHYTVEASPGETIKLAPEPDYNGDGELLYRWMCFDAEQGIYVELPDETGSTLEITVSEDEFDAEALYACEVSDGEVSGMAVFTLAVGQNETMVTSEEVALFSNVVLSGTLSERINALKNIFPAGKFWNHYVSKSSESRNQLITDWNESFQDSVTSTPCTSHSANGSVGRYDCNYFDGGIQCDGFARRVFYRLFGVRMSSSAQRSDTANLSIGDYVWLGGHAGVVYSINGSSFTMIECNDSGANNEYPQNNCRICWGKYTYYKSNIAYFIHASNYDEVLGTSKPDMTANMSANDYLTYYAQSVTTFTGTATPKNGTLKMYNLPTTLSNTVSYTTTTGSVKLTKKVVNHAGNTWYQIDSGKFVYSGDINISSAPTIINIDKGSITQTTAVIKAEVGHSSSNKPTSWTLEYGTTENLSNAKTHTEEFTDAVLSAYNPVPISVTFGVEEPNLKPGTRYYYRFTVKSANAALVVSEIRDFYTLECSSHSYNSLGVCTACGTSYDWNSTRSANSSWLKGNMTVRSTPYDAAASIGSAARIQAQATVKNCSGILWYQVSYNGQTGYIKADLATIFTPVAGITLSHSSASLVPGDTLSLAATILPSGATEKSVTWSSNSTSVATVSQSGVVTAVSPGTAVIKVTSIDNASATASCTVTVSSILTTQVIIDSVFSEAEIDVPVKLEAHVLPTNATVQGVNWVVKNGTGSGEISNGYFIGRSAGTVTLEAHSADGITYNTMTVTVKLSGASIEEGLRAAIANKDEAYYISGDVTLSADIVIPDYLTLYIEDSGSLTIPNGVTLTNNSFIGIYSNITIQSGGKIINNNHLRTFSGSSIAVDEGGTLENNAFISLIYSPLYMNGTYVHDDESTIFVVATLEEDESQLFTGISKELVTMDYIVTTEDEIRAALAKIEDGYDEVDVELLDKSVMLTSDLTIPMNCLLMLEGSLIFTVPQGKRLINDGELVISEQSSLVIETGAVLENNNSVRILGTMNVQGSYAGYNADLYTGGVLIPNTVPHCTEGVLVESIDILGQDTVLINSENEYAYVLAPDDVWINWAAWSIVSGDSLAEIGKYTGILKTKNTEGEVVIRASALDDSGIYEEKTIVIKSAFDYTLTVTSSDDTMGTVTGGGKYSAGATATITATAKSGYEFVKWNDGNTSASRTVTVDADKTYTATFKKKVDTNAAVFAVSSTASRAGECVDITVAVSKNPGIASFSISVEFDSSILTPVSVTPNTSIVSSITSNVDSGSTSLTEVTAFYSDTTGFTANGTLYTIRFKVSEDIEDCETALTLKIGDTDIVDPDLNFVPTNCQNGTIKISSIMYGDVNQDGKVNGVDAILMARYLAKWDLSFSSAQMLAMDVNGDGKVNGIDAIILARYLAKWDIKLGPQ